MKNLIITNTLRDELVSQLEFLSHFVCGGGQETIEELQGKLTALKPADSQDPELHRWNDDGGAQ